MRRQLTFAIIVIIGVATAVLYFVSRPSGPNDTPGLGMNKGPATEEQRREGQTLNSREAAQDGREAPLR